MRMNLISKTILSAAIALALVSGCGQQNNPQQPIVANPYPNGIYPNGAYPNGQYPNGIGQWCQNQFSQNPNWNNWYPNGFQSGWPTGFPTQNIPNGYNYYQPFGCLNNGSYFWMNNNTMYLYSMYGQLLNTYANIMSLSVYPNYFFYGTPTGYYGLNFQFGIQIPTFRVLPTAWGAGFNWGYQWGGSWGGGWRSRTKSSYKYSSYSY